MCDRVTNDKDFNRKINAWLRMLQYISILRGDLGGKYAMVEPNVGRSKMSVVHKIKKVG
jgi:hypothetical protein